MITNKLYGLHFIGFKRSGKGNLNFHAKNPKNGQIILPDYKEATFEEINEAVVLAERAFEQLQNIPHKKRSFFLHTLADELEKKSDDLINKCMQETALPKERLKGELNRTTNQIRMFADLLLVPGYLEARIDKGDSKRKPTPKPDIRQMQIPIGPVGIFGASNFPLAFSVAGGDTISALSAGCPVVFKAHPLHPGTSEIVAETIVNVAKATKMPEGIFNMVYGATNQTGEMLVSHRGIKAVAFTGSFKGGKALFDLASKRPVPIPVFAEMGSINPVFILPEAQTETDYIASEIFSSITLGCGQFCTNPGLIFLQKCQSTKKLIDKLSVLFKSWSGGFMLSESIASNYKLKTKNLSLQKSIKTIQSETQPETTCHAHLFITDFQSYINNKQWNEEVFGPSSMVIIAQSVNEIELAAKNLRGVLCSAIYSADNQISNYKKLIHILSQKAGRINYNTMPTGVEVCHAINHGGPFPATTNAQYTSVGTASIKRFLRPVCYQNFPDKLLPDAIKNDNPLKIPRLINGKLVNI